MTRTANTRKDFNRVSRSKPRRAGLTEEMRENMRAIGFFFLLLSALALAFDTWTMMSGRGLLGFSGIKDIWGGLDMTSLVVIQQMIMLKLGVQAWDYVLQPVMSLPAAALFGVPGLVLLRRYSPEIQVRAPSRLEMEMQRAGLNPRTGSRRRY